MATDTSKSRENAARMFKEHFDHLVLFVNQYVCSIAVSEDIVQDLFLKLWEKDRLTNETPTFLYTCARNAALNYLRTNRLESFSIEACDSFDIEDQVEEQMAYMDKLERMYKAIESLSPQCREVLKKIYFEGKSYAETAEEMNLSLSTIKTHIYLAIKNLKKDFAYIGFLIF